MPRYRLTLEYDGAPFAGWQIQPDAHGATVQGAITRAIRAFTGETVTVYGAGRTDAGVHALGQVAHIDLAKAWEPVRVREALNFHLRPNPVAVLDCAVVDDAFDARFGATARHYLYRILNRRARPTLDRDRVWWVSAPLDAEAMATAAQALVGHHDFTTFRAAACQAKSPARNLDRLDVTRAGDEIRVEASARSFLHHQVRSMVGSLKLVGEGKWTAGDLAEALAARDRTRCGPVVPAGGLYLVRVDYGEHGGGQSSPVTASEQVMIGFAPSDTKPSADLRDSKIMTLPSTPSNALVRPREGAMIAGVCAGLARWLGWDVTVVRLLYIVLTLASVAFPGILVYIVLWFLMPREPA